MTYEEGLVFFTHKGFISGAHVAPGGLGMLLEVVVGEEILLVGKSKTDAVPPRIDGDGVLEGDCEFDVVTLGRRDKM